MLRLLPVFLVIGVLVCAPALSYAQETPKDTVKDVPKETAKEPVKADAKAGDEVGTTFKVPNPWVVPVLLLALMAIGLVVVMQVSGLRASIDKMAGGSGGA